MEEVTKDLTIKETRFTNAMLNLYKADRTFMNKEFIKNMARLKYGEDTEDMDFDAIIEKVREETTPRKMLLTNLVQLLVDLKIDFDLDVDNGKWYFGVVTPSQINNYIMVSVDSKITIRINTKQMSIKLGSLFRKHQLKIFDSSHMDVRDLSDPMTMTEILEILEKEEK